MKRRKPDILIILALVLGLGISLSSMTQGSHQERVSAQQLKASGILMERPSSQ